MSYKDGTELRHHHIEVNTVYDGSVDLHGYAEVVTPEGISLMHHVGHTHRLPPNAWHGLYLADAVREVVDAHYAARGLTRPEGDRLHHHLHPRGFPGTTHYAPVPPRETEAPNAERLPQGFWRETQAAIVAAIEKETRQPLPEHIYPLQAEVARERTQ